VTSHLTKLRDPRAVPTFERSEARQDPRPSAPPAAVLSILPVGNCRNAFGSHVHPATRSQADEMSVASPLRNGGQSWGSIRKVELWHEIPSSWAIKENARSRTERKPPVHLISQRVPLLSSPTQKGSRPAGGNHRHRSGVNSIGNDREGQKFIWSCDVAVLAVMAADKNLLRANRSSPRT
jgi:hypothetical protein